MLCFTVLQGQNGWEVTYDSTHICALEGATVDIRCNYRYPSSVTIKKKFWSIKNYYDDDSDLKEEQYSGRVKYICGFNDCTLRIKNLRESDAAVYKFRFISYQATGKYTGEPGVTLEFVTGNIFTASHLALTAACAITCLFVDHRSTARGTCEEINSQPGS